MAKPKKSVDARRSRRRRYIEAIEPFRQQFNCTAAQVHGIINNIMRENAELKKTIASLEQKIEDMKAEYDEQLSSRE